MLDPGKAVAEIQRRLNAGYFGSHPEKVKLRICGSQTP
jgi:hypothetical protein